MYQRLLPTEWVEQVFSLLLTRYGNAFLRQYEGVNLDGVKMDWRRELGGFVRSGKGGIPEAPAVLYALEHLPQDRPPNVMQFRAICHGWSPAPERHRLPGRRVQIPPDIRMAMQQILSKPVSDEPERVRIARRYVETFGQPGLQLSHLQRKTLAEKRAQLERWEHQPVEGEAA